MRLKKCGEFMEKDGIVVKRPGKKFVCPPLPEKLKLSYNLENCSGREREDIEQMNDLIRQRWQKDRKSEYAAMRRLYYFQQLVRFVRQTAQRMIQRLSSQDKFVQPDMYGNICSFERNR